MPFTSVVPDKVLGCSPGRLNYLLASGKLGKGSFLGQLVPVIGKRVHCHPFLRAHFAVSGRGAQHGPSPAESFLRRQLCGDKEHTWSAFPAPAESSPDPWNFRSRSSVCVTLMRPLLAGPLKSSAGLSLEGLSLGLQGQTLSPLTSREERRVQVEFPCVASDSIHCA